MAGYAVNQEQLLGMAETAKDAEKLGYDSIWTAEAYGFDSGTPLAYFAAKTEKIRLGSAIFQIPGRTPGNAAMTAATIDNLSNGRFNLGLGSSGPQVAEGWHGQPFAKQIQRTREYVTILRKMFAKEYVEFDGEIYKLPLPDGLGKPLKLMVTPIQDTIPIYLAAIGPKNTQLAGELCDGWLPYLYGPEHASYLNENLAIGAERGGRTIDDIAISPRFSRRPATATSLNCAIASARFLRSTSAVWARAARTSTTRSSVRTATKTTRKRSKICTSTKSTTKPPRRCPRT